MRQQVDMSTRYAVGDKPTTIHHFPFTIPHLVSYLSFSFFARDTVNDSPLAGKLCEVPYDDLSSYAFESTIPHSPSTIRYLFWLIISQLIFYSIFCRENENR